MTDDDPMTSDEKYAAMRDADDDLLRAFGHDPDTLDNFQRADLLDEIAYNQEQEHGH